MVRILIHWGPVSLYLHIYSTLELLVPGTEPPQGFCLDPAVRGGDDPLTVPGRLRDLLNCSGTPQRLLNGLVLTMGSGPSVPTDSPLGCLLNNLKPLHLTPDLKPVRYCNEIWPQYPLDNQSKWPPNGSLNPKILRNLYNFCEHTGKWKEIPYIQTFSYLRTKLSLCLPCNPKHLLLALKSTPLSFFHIPKYPQLPIKLLYSTPPQALLSPPGSCQELCLSSHCIITSQSVCLCLSV